MQQKIRLHYINEHLQVDLSDIKHVYLLSPELTLLHSEVYKGKLVDHDKGSNRCISYDQMKQGLVKPSSVVKEQVPIWLLK